MTDNLNSTQTKAQLLESYPDLSFKKRKPVNNKILKNTEKKKPPNAGKGRGKGNLNKTTIETKIIIQKLIEFNHNNLPIWLANVALTDPAKALDIIIRLTDFVVPKLARQELVGKDGKDLIPVTANSVVDLLVSDD